MERFSRVGNKKLNVNENGANMEQLPTILAQATS